MSTLTTIKVARVGEAVRAVNRLESMLADDVKEDPELADRLRNAMVWMKQVGMRFREISGRPINLEAGLVQQPERPIQAGHLSLVPKPGGE